MLRATLAVACLALAAGCSSSQHHEAANAPAHTEGGAQVKPQAVSPASDTQRAALLDRVKQLAGTWELVEDPSNHETAAVFSVTSADSAVREIMFPGTPHEMTNMYHMDGSTLVMTHYCAQGNQPRLRASAPSDAHQINLTLDSVTNMTSPNQEYMGGLVIEFKDADTIVERWTSFKNGKPEEHAVFELKRKKV